MSPPDLTRWTGHHLAVVERAHWEFATRPGARGVVAIVPLTDEGEIVLVEQLRLPVAARVIELPAGLAGDLPGAEDEHLLTAARRELLEETGFEAASWSLIADGPSSAGMTDERVHLYLARGLVRRTAGGGDGSEDIEVHVVPLTEAPAWLAAARDRGVLVDHKVLTGLFLAGAAWDGTCWHAR